ncbi:hypothetical protein KJ564_08310 [bacterium]|nr:hypothetical protein [bacterium]
MRKIIGILIFVLVVNSAFCRNNQSSKIQPSMYIGYVGNFIKEPFGVFIHGINPNKFGFYIDIKLAISPGNVYDNISVQQAESWGDSYLGEMNHYETIDIGLSKVIHSAGVVAFLGLGITKINHYQEYFDEMYILGEDGHYYVDEDMRFAPNLNLGLLMVASKSIVFVFGADLQPFGVNLGIGFNPTL